MMFRLDGRKALVTGATRGLGRAISLALAEAGATLAMNYRRDEASAAKALGEVRALAPNSLLVRADLEDQEQVRAMVKEAAQALGGLDIYIANAAATAFKPLLEAKPHHLNRTFNLSVTAFVLAVQESAAMMAEGGRIVMISGIDSIRYLPGHGILGAAKAGLESMVRSLAFELGPRQITVNGLNMGMIDTESSRFYLGDNFERAVRSSIERSALRRIPRLEELAAAVRFLCTPAASAITGQTLMVDCGATLSSPF